MLRWVRIWKMVLKMRMLRRESWRRHIRKFMSMLVIVYSMLHVHLISQACCCSLRMTVFKSCTYSDWSNWTHCSSFLHSPDTMYVLCWLQSFPLLHLSYPSFQLKWSDHILLHNTVFLRVEGLKLWVIQRVVKISLGVVVLKWLVK